MTYHIYDIFYMLIIIDCDLYYVYVNHENQSNILIYIFFFSFVPTIYTSHTNDLNMLILYSAMYNYSYT